MQFGLMPLPQVCRRYDSWRQEDICERYMNTSSISLSLVMETFRIPTLLTVDKLIFKSKLIFFFAFLLSLLLLHFLSPFPFIFLFVPLSLLLLSSSLHLFPITLSSLSTFTAWRPVFLLQYYTTRPLSLLILFTIFAGLYADKADLKTSDIMVKRGCKWLSTIKQTSTINKSRPSDMQNAVMHQFMYCSPLKKGTCTRR